MCLLIIERALYGLRTSGARWHDRFADCLRQEGFTPCKSEPDIWMRRNGDLYEYIAVYVDGAICWDERNYLHRWLLEERLTTAFKTAPAT